MVNKDVYINKKTAEIIYSHNDRVVPTWPQTITIYSLQEAIKLHRVRSRRKPFIDDQSVLRQLCSIIDDCKFPLTLIILYW